MTACPRDACLPSWLDGEPAVGERMLALAHRVAQQAVGQSRRGRGQARGSVVFALRAAGTSPASTDPGSRDTRAKVLAALRAALATRADPVRLESALRDAVLLDELALLPPRQRYALWATALRHRSVAEVAAATGWTPAQVARLVRAALRTVTAQARPCPASGRSFPVASSST